MIKVLTQKIGMTSLFTHNGALRAATILRVPSQIVVSDIDGNKSGKKVIVGAKTDKNRRKSVEGQLKKNNIKVAVNRFFEVDSANLAKNQELKAELFNPGDKVTVIGISKGKGFQGTIKRHGFHRGPKTHGSNNYRQPGSIGSAYPQRVVKGKKMAGRMGGERITIKGLEVIDISKDDQTVIVSGAVPGPNRSFNYIQKTN